MGEPKSIASERGNFLLNPIAPGGIIHAGAPAAAGTTGFPQDTEQGDQGLGLVHPTAGSQAPSPPQPEENAQKTRGEDKQQQNENIAKKNQLQRYRKLSKLQGHQRLCRQMGHQPREFGEVIPPWG